MNKNEKDLTEVVAKAAVSIVATCIAVAVGAIILALAYKLISWMIF